jgi:hypothetical protein
MAEGFPDPNAHRAAVVNILSKVPTHSESSMTVEEIAALVASESAVFSTPVVEGMVGVILVVLDTVGILATARGRYKLRGPIPLYFLYSLTWYVVNDRRIVDNWLRVGVRDETATSQLLETAPHVLKLMEEKRLRLAGVRAEPKRRQRVAFTLVKARQGGSRISCSSWIAPRSSTS